MKTNRTFYLSKFRGKHFVLKISGEIIANASILASILQDIQELFERGIFITLVHGGGPQADALSLRLGHTPTKINGRRVTTAKDLEIAKMVFGGTLNIDILSAAKKLGIKGMRVSGMEGDLLDVVKRPVRDVDYGFVGDIKSVHPAILKDLVRKKYLPIIPPLAADRSGTILNINADTIATEIAIALKAEKLIFFTKCDGIYQDKTLLSHITLKDAHRLIDDGIATDGMRVKLETCIRAISGGVKRVHILNGLSPHSLLTEVFTKNGVGTMVSSISEHTRYLRELR